MFTPKDEVLVGQVLKRLQDNKSCKLISAINKNDLEKKLDIKIIKDRLVKTSIVGISAKHQIGFDKLEQVLLKEAFSDEAQNEGEGIITNLRQKKSLENALMSLEKAYSSCEQNLSGEFIAIDLREAMNALGEIVGEVTNEDILDNIFSKFCIGK